MKHPALFTLLSLALSCPVLAKPHHFHLHHHYAVRTSHRVDQYAGHVTTHASHAGITCEMVRAYVAKVGLGQAIAMAQSAGISAADEHRARKCLAKQI
jgi:hypothetical protein